MAKDGVDKLTTSLTFDEFVLSHKTVRTHPQPFGHPDGATIAGIDIRDDTMGVKTWSQNPGVSVRDLRACLGDRSAVGSKQDRLIADRLWELIEPLIPPRPPAKGPGGRPRIDDRAALEGILFVLHTGCRWRDLPLQLGCGSGHTAWRRLRAWQAAGVWDRLHQAVLDELSDAAVIDWSRGCIDAVAVRAKRGAS